MPHAEELLDYVEGIVAEMHKLFPLDWRSDLELGQATALVEAAVRERHPELSAEAAVALAWMWSYSAWK